MSPITSQSSVSYRTVRLGGYRLLDLPVIGAMVICLFVIGLAGAVVIGRSKISQISENITGRDGAGQASKISENFSETKTTIQVYNYPGVLGLIRLGRPAEPPFPLDGMYN